MGYQVKLKTVSERQATIEAAVKASTKSTDFFEFRNTKTPLPLVRVSEDVLVYRMENFRTYIDQREYTARQSKPLDYFNTGQENDSVQQVQHEFLWKLARKGIAESVVPVVDVLRRDKQREPLLVTRKGMVVNGNRRLAAMRELRIEDPAAFAEFGHIDCLVLPEDTTSTEIVDIEAALQAKPETRLDYDWIGDCQLIRRMINLRTGPDQVEQVAIKLNRKPAEIKNSLSALDEAELYLKTWVRADDDYRRVEDAEQLFKDLPVNLQGKSVALQEASRAIAWTLFENRRSLDDRLYAFNPAFGKLAASVLDQVTSELGLPDSDATDLVDGDFQVDVDDEDAVPSYRPLVDALRGPNRKEAVDTLISVSRQAIDAERGRKSGQAALKAITTANSRLAEADLNRADRATFDSIGKQLDQIEVRVKALRATLSTLTRPPPAASGTEKPAQE